MITLSPAQEAQLTADRIPPAERGKATAARTAVLGPDGPARPVRLPPDRIVVLRSRAGMALGVVAEPAGERPFPCRSPGAAWWCSPAVSFTAGESAGRSRRAIAAR